MNGSNFKRRPYRQGLAIANEQPGSQGAREALKEVFKIANEQVALVPVFWPASAMAINKKYKLSGYNAFWSIAALGDARVGHRLALWGHATPPFHSPAPPPAGSPDRRFRQRYELAMSHLADVIARLDRVRYPADLSFVRQPVDRRLGPPPAGKRTRFPSRIWRFA